MKLLATVMVFKLLKMEQEDQLKYLKKNLKSQEFMELIYLGYHTAIDFRFKMEEVQPRPQAPLDYHKTFFSKAMACVRDQFNEDKRKSLKEFIESTDGLSRYIYSKIINKNLGLSRNDLEENIPGLIVKEPYELISIYGAPKLPCLLQMYNRGIEAVVTIGDTKISRNVNVLKNKGGLAVSGFNKHIDAIKSLGLKGTFNVVITGENEEIYTEHVLGDNSREALDTPLIIIDYQVDVGLAERITMVECALIENYTPLVELAYTVYVKDLEDIHLEYQHGFNKAVARQNIEPVLWEEGSHSIDVSFLL